LKVEDRMSSVLEEFGGFADPSPVSGQWFNADREAFQPLLLFGAANFNFNSGESQHSFWVLHPRWC
jgi:hypothetical protein